MKLDRNIRLTYSFDGIKRLVLSVIDKMRISEHLKIPLGVVEHWANVERIWIDDNGILYVDGDQHDAYRIIEDVQVWEADYGRLLK